MQNAPFYIFDRVLNTPLKWKDCKNKSVRKYSRWHFKMEVYNLPSPLIILPFSEPGHTLIHADGPNNTGDLAAILHTLSNHSWGQKLDPETPNPNKTTYNQKSRNNFCNLGWGDTMGEKCWINFAMTGSSTPRLPALDEAWNN